MTLCYGQIEELITITITFKRPDLSLKNEGVKDTLAKSKWFDYSTNLSYFTYGWLSSVTYIKSVFSEDEL